MRMQHWYVHSSSRIVDEYQGMLAEWGFPGGADLQLAGHGPDHLQGLVAGPVRDVVRADVQPTLALFECKEGELYVLYSLGSPFGRTDGRRDKALLPCKSMP